MSDDDLKKAKKKVAADGEKKKSAIGLLRYKYLHGGEKEENGRTKVSAKCLISVAFR